MKLPVDIRFIGLEPSQALEDTARRRIAHIDSQNPDLVGWHVAIEQPHRHGSKGREFSVRIQVTMTGRDLAVERIHDEDAWAALGDAFDAIHRRIQDAERMRRGMVKQRAQQAQPSQGKAT